MLLNSELVEKIGEVLVKSLNNVDNGSYIIEHDLGDELLIKFVRGSLDSHWVINDVYFESNIGSISESKRHTHKDIANLLVKLAIIKADQGESVQDMFNGLSLNVTHDSVIGLTVKFHSEDPDSRRLMIAQTANPDNVLYAIEEAVNQELSIDPELMTSSRDLLVRTLSLFSDYLLADLITHDVAI